MIPKLTTKVPKMALPLILSNITVPLLGLNNTFIVGHLNHSYYLAAIGLGAMIFNFLYWGLGFFRMSTTGLIAQAFGAKDQEKICSILLHSISAAIGFGLLIILIQYPLYQFFIYFIHPDKTVLHLLYQYYSIRIWGAPAVLLSFVIVGTMVAIQKTRGPLIMLGITNLLAILFCLPLVFIFHLNLKGIAIADVVAQYCGLIVGLMTLARYFDFSELLTKTQLEFKKVIELLHTNRDVFIRTLCLITVFSFFTIYSSHISPLVLATNTLLMNFFQIMANALGGFDNVAEALTGEAVGKGSSQDFKQAFYDVGVWALICSVIFTFIYFVFGKELIHIMTNLETVRQTSYQYLPYVALLPVTAFASFFLDGVAIGANCFKEMRNSMLLTIILFFIIWFILSPYQNTGLWLSFFSFFILRAIFLGFYVFKFWTVLQAQCHETSGQPPPEQ